MYLSKWELKEFIRLIDKTSEICWTDPRNKNPKEFTYKYPNYIPEYIRSTAFDSKFHPMKKYKLFIQFSKTSSKEWDVILILLCEVELQVGKFIFK